MIKPLKSHLWLSFCALRTGEYMDGAPIHYKACRSVMDLLGSLMVFPTVLLQAAWCSLGNTHRTCCCIDRALQAELVFSDVFPCPSIRIHLTIFNYELILSYCFHFLNKGESKGRFHDKFLLSSHRALTLRYGCDYWRNSLLWMRDLVLLTSEQVFDGPSVSRLHFGEFCKCYFVQCQKWWLGRN